MRGDVIKRLQSLGYTCNDETDTWIIMFTIQKVEDYIKNDCNITSIPIELYEVVINRVCGEFLLVKKGNGKLDGFDLTPAVSKISEGDTTVTFAFGDGSRTPESRLDELIKYLINYGKNNLIAFRRIRW